MWLVILLGAPAKSAGLGPVTTDCALPVALGMAAKGLGAVRIIQRKSWLKGQKALPFFPALGFSDCV